MAPDPNAIATEVSNLKDGHAQLRGELRNLEGKVDSGFALMVQKLDARTTPNWQPIGIAVGIIMSFGGWAYTGMNEKANKQEAMIEVMRREAEARIIKLWDETNKTARELSNLQGQLHPLQK